MGQPAPLRKGRTRQVAGRVLRQLQGSGGQAADPGSSEAPDGKAYYLGIECDASLVLGIYHTKS